MSVLDFRSFLLKGSWVLLDPFNGLFAFLFVFIASGSNFLYGSIELIFNFFGSLGVFLGKSLAFCGVEHFFVSHLQSV